MYFSFEQYINAYGNAPESIRSLLESNDTAEKFETLFIRYGIIKNPSVIEVFGNTLVGLIPVKYLIKELQAEAGLDAETAKNLAHDVRAEIFAPVAQELADMQGKAEENWQKATQEAKDTEGQKTEVPQSENDTEEKHKSEEKKPEISHRDE